MDRERQRKEYEDHFAALRRLAGGLSSRLARALRRGELARYDERLLRDMGLSAYDIRRPRQSMTQMVATWLDRSRQRKHLACFTERDLRDIAISKCDADAEIEKPFWRA